MDHMLVDAMTVRMTLHPKSLDTILATNLHADILSDLAAGKSRRAIKIPSLPRHAADGPTQPWQVPSA